MSLDHKGQAEPKSTDASYPLSQFEREILKTLRQSKCSNLSQIYRKFYAQSDNPKGIQNLFLIRGSMPESDHLDSMP